MFAGTGTGSQSGSAFDFRWKVARVDVVERRRQLHRRPEVGFCEFFTSWVVITELSRLGYELRWGSAASDLSVVRGLPTSADLARAKARAVAYGADPGLLEELDRGGTAIVARLRGSRPGPVTALRFDMDALPLSESDDPSHPPIQCGFRSEHAGEMHACGHDGHVAIGLALAERLADRDFAGEVRLVFQPAEEGGRGAAPLVAAGACEDVDRLLCLHLGLNLPLGSIAAGSSGFFANSKLKAVFKGVPSHAAAAPEQGRNALLGAATALLNIHSLPRFSTADTRVNVGTLWGGTAANIVAADAQMMIETRATDGEVNLEMTRRVHRVLDHAAAMQELHVQVEDVGGATTAVCDLDLVRHVRRSAEALPGQITITDDHDVKVSDDATLLMRAVQSRGGLATYMVVGASSPGPHHSPTFDIDERALPLSVDLLERCLKESVGV